jgi:hypothetical protein
MTSQQLKDLILAQPDGSPIRVAYDRGDAEAAIELNRKTIPAFVPRRHLLTVLERHSLTWVIDQVRLHNVIPGTSQAPPKLLSQLCSKLWWVLNSSDDDQRALRTPADAELDAGCGVFAAFSEVQGATAASIKAELVAGAGLISRIEATFGLDKQVNAEQIAATRFI